MKRKIKSHKGGRSETIKVRCTPETKQAIKDLAAFRGISEADLVEQLVKDERERQAKK